MGKINLDILKSRLESGASQAECSREFNVSEAAVCKAVQKLKAAVLPESVKALTGKQRAFSMNLAGGMTPTESAMTAYHCKDRQVAAALGSRMAKEPDIEIALVHLMAQEKIPLRRRIQRVGHLIESNDLSAVSRGLDMSFKLDGSYVAEKVVVEVDFKAMQIDLNKAIEAMKAEQEIIDITEA